MDKVMKAEIREIVRLAIKTKEQELATNALTSLIIKWLEKADICDECKNKLLTNLTDRI